MMQGVITDIQHFSIHDGPGIRTTVFFKGCSQRCFWCHNPETLLPQPQLQLFLDRCIGCGACFEACPEGAHQSVDGERSFNREACTGCGACVDTCYAQALVLVGETKSADEIVETVLRDRAFYETSGGGVTLSGGEPLLQLDFAEAILSRCRDAGIHTAVETAANLPWEQLARILPVTDLLMMDIKVMDSERHRDVTGVPNERILENARRLGEQPIPLIVRTPIVPGVNDDEASVAAIATFVAGLPNLVYYELLRFHGMAESKYASLEMDHRARDLVAPTKARMEELTEVARTFGLDARHS
jgi:pyruvate formate lyase activating enzyme